MMFLYFVCTSCIYLSLEIHKKMKKYLLKPTWTILMADFYRSLWSTLCSNQSNCCSVTDRFNQSKHITGDRQWTDQSSSLQCISLTHTCSHAHTCLQLLCTWIISMSGWRDPDHLNNTSYFLHFLQSWTPYCLLSVQTVQTDSVCSNTG